MSKAISSKRAEPSYRFQRVHPTLITGHALTVKAQRTEPVQPFVQQSPLDSACGVHVIAAILSITALVKPSALADMSRRKHGVAATIWRAFGDTYFSGVFARDWVERLEGLGLPLQLTPKYARQDAVDAHVLDWLMQGSLVALVLHSVRHTRTKHWSLAVGAEGAFLDGKHHVDTVLLLDPATDGPMFAAHNARLRLKGHALPKRVSKAEKTKRPRPVTWLYESLAWNAEEVHLEAAVRVCRTS
ncbi:MAG: hypothetical protein O9337_02430 [Acidovorax sp.]|uniref:hypothetical protein n=1 Tax=Acidovorax sp. TaxID=1872122 RepID=UPI0022BE0094|nr:hypothetical protein [Acidovorax sp.]MCZ8218251.1 hypothetical protein [Acidovorax sp.]